MIEYTLTMWNPDTAQCPDGHKGPHEYVKPTQAIFMGGEMLALQIRHHMRCGECKKNFSYMVMYLPDQGAVFCGDLP